MVDTFEVIAGLEGQSGELAAQRITEAELAEIRALHYEMMAAYTRRDLSAYYRLNASIHEKINLAARNPVLTPDLPHRQRPAAGAALPLQLRRSQMAPGGAGTRADGRQAGGARRRRHARADDHVTSNRSATWCST